MTATTKPLTTDSGRSHRVRLLRVGLVCAVIAAGVLLWTEVLRDRLVAKRWGVVEAGRVYRSGQLSRHLVESQLKAHGILVVVDLMGDDPGNREQPFEREAISRLGIELVRCPLIGDGTGDIREYARAITAIERARQAGKPVLVHCYAGSQRTGGVVAMYRLLVRGEPIDSILAELPRYDWRPHRDRVLLEYLDKHLHELVALLNAEGLLVRPGVAYPSLVDLQYGSPRQPVTNTAGHDAGSAQR